MKETDKLIADLMTKVKNSKLEEKQSAENNNILKVPEEKNSTSEIGKLLNELNLSVAINDGFIFVEGQGDICNFAISPSAVAQEEYEKVMGYNPSYFKLKTLGLSQEIKDRINATDGSSKYPVEQVCWYDAIYFCNKKSIDEGLVPVYGIGTENETDIYKWDYIPRKHVSISKTLQCNFSANGYRLPTYLEWRYAAKGGKKSNRTIYAGSDNLEEVAWYKENSTSITHPVCTKNPNTLGLYDMNGNVWEWIWDKNTDGNYSNERFACGGSFYDKFYEKTFRISTSRKSFMTSRKSNYLGFRIVRTVQ